MDELEKVRAFIAKKSAANEVRDQLHAIWSEVISAILEQF